MLVENSSSAGQFPDLSVFTDSDFAGCTQTFRSTSGVILYYRGCPLIWSSKRQTIRAYSTTEAEYCAAFDGIVILERQGYLSWFLQNDSLPWVHFVDNLSAIEVSRQSIPSKKSKHYALRFLKVRDNSSQLNYCPSGQNLADGLTKALSRINYMNMLRSPASDSFDDDSETSFLAFLPSVSLFC